MTLTTKERWAADRMRVTVSKWKGKRRGSTAGVLYRPTAIKRGHRVNFGDLKMYKSPEPPPPEPDEGVIITPDIQEVVTDALVDKFVASLPPQLVESKAMTVARYARHKVKAHIKLAREQFRLNAMTYTQIHLRAVENALAERDYDTARKGSEWALERISEGGERLIDKEEKGQRDQKVMIGIQLGGIPAVKQLTSESEG